MGDNVKPLKVLHIGADNVGYGGRSVIAFNLTQSMDEKVVINDFLVFHEVEDKYVKALKRKKGKYVTILINNKKIKLFNEIERTYQLCSEIKKNKYDIIHIHADDAYEAIKSVWIAKLAGIKYFVIHAHTTGSNEKYTFLKRVLIKFCQSQITRYKVCQLACSIEAARYLFGKRNKKEIHIIKNGINTQLFYYDTIVRQNTRKKLGYKKEQVVIGNIGRFVPSKNHIFLLDIFEKVLEFIPSARLLLIGNGNLKNMIEDIAKEKGIYQFIDFLGNRADVPQLLQAMDIFVLPSFFEGFGIVNLEAQCSGLPCIVSDKIPKSVYITDMITFLPLGETAELWANAICNAAYQENRRDYRNEIISAGFDINESALVLQNYYKTIKQDGNIR